MNEMLIVFPVYLVPFVVNDHVCAIADLWLLQLPDVTTASPSSFSVSKRMQAAADAATTPVCPWLWQRLTVSEAASPFGSSLSARPSDPAPSARHYHSSAVLGTSGYMAVSGGWDGDGQLLADVWLLHIDATEPRWIQLHAANTPVRVSAALLPLYPPQVVAALDANDGDCLSEWWTPGSVQVGGSDCAVSSLLLFAGTDYNTGSSAVSVLRAPSDWCLRDWNESTGSGMGQGWEWSEYALPLDANSTSATIYQPSWMDAAFSVLPGSQLLAFGSEGPTPKLGEHNAVIVDLPQQLLRAVPDTVPSAFAAACLPALRPSNRHSAISAMVGDDEWLVYGGVTVEAPTADSSELWSLHMHTEQWARLGPPAPDDGYMGGPTSTAVWPQLARAAASSNASGLFLCGAQPDPAKPDQQVMALWLWDTRMRAWTNLTSLLRPSTENGAPPPRGYHSLMVIDRRLWLFAGKGEDGQARDDMWNLDLDTLQWSVPLQQAALGQERPSGRFGHRWSLIRPQLIVMGFGSQPTPVGGEEQLRDGHRQLQAGSPAC